LTATAARLRAWALSLAENALPELFGPNQAIWLSRLDIEYGNLRAALRYGEEHPESVDAHLQLCATLMRLWEARSDLAEGRRWLEGALAVGGAPSASHRANALNLAAAFVYNQGD